MTAHSPACRCCCATNVAVISNLLHRSILNIHALGGERGDGGGKHCIRHKVFWYHRSAWTNVVHLRNPNRRRLNLEHNNSRISQVSAAHAPSRLAALIHNIHHRGNWWAKSRPNDFLRRQSGGVAGGTGIFFMTPRDLFMPRSRQITAYPYMRPRGCSQSTAALAARQERSCTVCEMGLQTRRHLSSTQETACRQQTPPPALWKKTTKTKQPPPKKKKNGVAPLMKATDAKPLVSLWSCLRPAVILLPLVPPFLICTKGENNLFLLYK